MSKRTLHAQDERQILVAPSPTERRALDSDYLEKLEESMPRRLLEVIERESTLVLNISTDVYLCE
jgi:hypothetical protein